jgi:hypothetical protein
MTPVEKMIPLEGSIETLAETSGTAQKLPNPEIDLTQEMHRLGKMMRKKQTSAKIGQLLKQVKTNNLTTRDKLLALKLIMEFNEAKFALFKEGV